MSVKVLAQGEPRSIPLATNLSGLLKRTRGLAIVVA